MIAFCRSWIVPYNHAAQLIILDIRSPRMFPLLSDHGRSTHLGSAFSRFSLSSPCYEIDNQHLVIYSPFFLLVRHFDMLRHFAGIFWDSRTRWPLSGRSGRYRKMLSPRNCSNPCGGIKNFALSIFLRHTTSFLSPAFRVKG